VPRFDPARWDVRVFGEVASPVRLTHDEFTAPWKEERYTDPW